MADQEQRARESERNEEDKYHQEREREKAERAERSAGLSQEELTPRDEEAD